MLFAQNWRVLLLLPFLFWKAILSRIYIIQPFNGDHFKRHNIRFMVLNIFEVFMKKIILGLTAFVLSGSMVLAEGFVNNKIPEHANVSAKHKVHSVKEAKALHDDANVILVGYIKESMPNDDEMFIFADETGSVPVEIDSDKWKGQTVTPQTKVMLIGEVEQKRNHGEIEVDSVTVLSGK